MVNTCACVNRCTEIDKETATGAVPCLVPKVWEESRAGLRAMLRRCVPEDDAPDADYGGGDDITCDDAYGAFMSLSQRESKNRLTQVPLHQHALHGTGVGIAASEPTQCGLRQTRS